ncbi:glycosyltransferase [Arsenicicoccus piscis]|uniref:D-inositol 3-phosphate glycosyltransferase n=1 Tax=Arsenicicoccus piscis TaxID=673954 RepID=A0ABQ6HRP9_9MICO|nr:glycosyltransferase [Arsenicicoccus piscis]MCH8626483.1 glycosyltransferase [Arsenicicoccus piscis]GMA21114.1 glycosyl transferase [Arsenicicoccus piscis]
MRVLHVSQPTEAGVPNVALALVADQVARGFEVTVACPTDEGYLAARAAEAGATVRHWAATRSPGPSSLAEARSLAAIVADVDPDVVHLHASKAGLAGRLAVRGRRPTIFMPHAWSFEAVTGPVARASALWERLATRWTDLTLCVSEQERRTGAAARCLARRTVVVPNGVDTDRWVPRDRETARAELGIGPVPLAVVVGRLARQKGQDVAIAAWPAVLEHLPGAQLVLVGDGPDRPALAAQVGMAGLDDSVRLVPGGDPTPWFAAADVVVLPSRWEGMPLVVLEAMAGGRSVVCSDVAGMSEALGASTPVVTPDDPAALADALVVRLTDPGLAALEGERNRARAVERFDVRAANARVAEVVAELA